jgi:hypothetical protein
MALLVHSNGCRGVLGKPRGAWRKTRVIEFDQVDERQAQDGNSPQSAQRWAPAMEGASLKVPVSTLAAIASYKAGPASTKRAG